MDTPIVNYTETARSGDPDAISTLINRALASKGISAAAKVKDGTLDIVLSSKIELTKKVANFIHRGVTKLNIESVDILHIQARIIGQDSIVWTEKFDLRQHNEVCKQSVLSSSNRQKTSIETHEDTLYEQNTIKSSHALSHKKRLSKNEKIVLFAVGGLALANSYVYVFLTNIWMGTLLLFLKLSLVCFLEKGNRWYERSFFNVFVFSTFFPVGAYFTWRNRNWRKTLVCWLGYGIVYAIFFMPSYDGGGAPANYVESPSQIENISPDRAVSMSTPNVSVGMSQALAKSNMNSFVNQNGGSYDCASFPDEPSYQICIYQGKSNFEFHIENGFVEKVF